MNFELKLILFIGRHLPRIPHITAVVNRLLKPWYLRKKREEVVVDVLGFKMKLNPAECVDGGLLFYPHLYESYEVEFLKKHLKPGDVFLDAGANIGFYSLIASQLVGNNGIVLAVEADPYNCRKLSSNLKFNDIKNVRVLNIGISDQEETLRLGLNTTGNRGSNSFLSLSTDYVEVLCSPLLHVIETHKINKISAAKFDIEGFEFRVLGKFFSDANYNLYPTYIIIEHNPEWILKAGGDAIELLKSKGYRISGKFQDNFMMVLEQRQGDSNPL
jgi:FkbM family methyltransferase